MSRKTKILYPHASEPLGDSDYIEVDVDKYWANQVKNLEQMSVEMTRSFFWQIMLVHLAKTPIEASEFKKYFWTPMAQNSRLNSILGRKLKGHRRELLIYDTAMSLKQLYDSVAVFEGEDSTSFPVDEEGVLFGNEGQVIGNAELVQYFVDLISSKDLAGIERLKSVVEVEGKFSVEDNDKAERWRHFCELVADHERLPTKKELKIKWFAKTEAQAFKWRNQLGLGGVPSG